MTLFKIKEDVFLILMVRKMGRKHLMYAYYNFLINGIECYFSQFVMKNSTEELVGEILKCCREFSNS